MSTLARTLRVMCVATLVSLSMLSLSACASSPLVTQTRSPGALNPCVRDSLSGLWSCMRVKRLVWLESKRQRLNARRGLRGWR